MKLYFRKTVLNTKQDTETTPHHSAMLNTETPPNSASISGPSKSTTSNTLFPGEFSHRTRRTTAQLKDVTCASKKNL